MLYDKTTTQSKGLNDIDFLRLKWIHTTVTQFSPLELTMLLSQAWSKELQYCVCGRQRSLYPAREQKQVLTSILVTHQRDSGMSGDEMHNGGS